MTAPHPAFGGPLFTGHLTVAKPFFGKVPISGFMDFLRGVQREDPGFTWQGNSDLTSIRFVFSGGEAPIRAVEKRLKEQPPPLRIDFNFKQLTFPDTTTTTKPKNSRPTVVCICGSTRFKEEITESNRKMTMEGKIVLAPGVFSHSGDEVTEEDKERLDQLHLAKIDMADEVLVVNPGGYIGTGCAREIEYAAKKGKHIIYSHTNEVPHDPAI